MKLKKTETEVVQSCLTLCNPMDCSPPGSSVHGIFQARVLEWVTISFNLPDPGIEPRSHALQADSLPFEPQGKPKQRCSKKITCWDTERSQALFLNVHPKKWYKEEKNEGHTKQYPDTSWWLHNGICYQEQKQITHLQYAHTHRNTG